MGSETTLDSLYHGALVLEQPRTGYRFSVDAPLLTAFAAERPARRAADFGAGCGVVGLGCLWLGAVKELTLVELQPGLARLARANVERNGFGPRCQVREADLRTLRPAAGEPELDLVVSNPPYHPLGRGKTPRDEMRAIARTERELPIAELCRAAKRFLKRNGRLCLVYPARRVDELLAVFANEGFEAGRLRFVQPRPDEAAELMLIEARQGRGGRTLVLPPWVLHDGDGKDTPFLSAILSGRAPDDPCAG